MIPQISTEERDESECMLHEAAHEQKSFSNKVAFNFKLRNERQTLV